MSGPCVPTPEAELNKCACCGCEIEWAANHATCTICGWEQVLLVMTDKESGETHYFVGPTPEDISDMARLFE